MYQVQLPHTSIWFEHALNNVPAGKEDVFWIDEFITVEESVDIEHTSQGVKVKSNSGIYPRVSLVSEVTPAIYSLDLLLDFIYQKILDSLEVTEVKKDKKNQIVVDIYKLSDELVPEITDSLTISDVTSQQTYVSGELIQVDWGKLGYAPGGIQNYILPKNGRAIDLDHLWLPWEKIQVSSS